MKKISGMIFSTVLMAAMFAGCSSTSSKEAAAPAKDATPAQTETATKETAKPFEGEITVVSREEGSGTRGAFIELFGIEQKNEAGEKVDHTTEEANISNSTSVVMTTVAGDETAIGYISLGSLNDTVKAVKIDGAPASVEAIKDGSYKIARPFNIATGKTVTEVAQDFINFILSADGQKVVEGAGYIAASDAGAFEGGKVSGKIIVAGSSSVTPVMEKLKEAYVAVNPNVEIEIQQSDSTTGMNSAISGICDIGMASRELKDSETGAGLTPTVIAIDGIAVVVNNNNPTEELEADDVKAVFMGEKTQWSELAK
ncbi:MAG: extracellular solute-binding protein [Lachnospiraceae bacterium]|nr:extracellular solute-binding protein [Lachnospiraceae bacterium]